MIKKEGSKYNVYSEDGSKHLGSYKTKEEAEQRLRQIEWFKAHSKTSDEAAKTNIQPAQRSLLDFMQALSHLKGQ